MFCECEGPDYSSAVLETVKMKADTSVVEGYYYDAKFYYDSAHTKEIEPLVDSFYIDITTPTSPKLYFYSQDQYNTQTGSGGTSDFSISIVSELPETGKSNTIYMVAGETETSGYAKIMNTFIYRGNDTTAILGTMKLDYAKLG